MNLFSKIFFIVIWLSIFVYSQDCKNLLIINSDISEIKVQLNDSPISFSGKRELELPDGEYIIVAEDVSGRWNAKIFSDTIKLAGCETKSINYFFQSDILLETIPSDAYVFSSDSLLGSTPLKFSRNLQQLKITKPGYLEKQISLTDEKIQTVKLEFNGLVKSEPFVNTTLFKVLTGSAVVLGAVTAYFKLKADDKYDEYKYSGDKKFLDETNRFDTISGISLALFQINFGYIIYRFLAE